MTLWPRFGFFLLNNPSTRYRPFELISLFSCTRCPDSLVRSHAWLPLAPKLKGFPDRRFIVHWHACSGSSWSGTFHCHGELDWKEEPESVLHAQSRTRPDVIVFHCSIYRHLTRFLGMEPRCQRILLCLFQALVRRLRNIFAAALLI